MRLTKIQQQAKSKDRYNLFVEDQFWMGVHQDIIIGFDLLKPRDITAEELDLIAQAEFEKSVTQKALSYLSRSMRTSQQVYDYLQTIFKEAMDQGPDHHQHIQGLIAQTMDYLTQAGYLDDQAYIKAYLATQEALSPKGDHLLRQELVAKGLDLSMVQDHLDSRDQVQVRQGAVDLAEKFLRTKQKLPAQKRQEKLKELLYRKGFDRETIQEVLSIVDNESDQEAEWDSLVIDGQKSLTKHQRKWSGYDLKQKIKMDLIRKGYQSQQIQDWLRDYADID